jgi:hypothetical protein
LGHQPNKKPRISRGFKSFDLSRVSCATVTLFPKYKNPKSMPCAVRGPCSNTLSACALPLLPAFYRAVPRLTRRFEHSCNCRRPFRGACGISSAPAQKPAARPTNWFSVGGHRRHRRGLPALHRRQAAAGRPPRPPQRHRHAGAAVAHVPGLLAGLPWRGRTADGIKIHHRSCKVSDLVYRESIPIGTRHSFAASGCPCAAANCAAATTPTAKALAPRKVAFLHR